MEQIIFLVFFVLQVGDYLTTVEILKRGGKELNPVMKWIIDRVGAIPAMFFSRVAIIGAVWWANTFWLTLTLSIVYMAVVGHNLFQLNKVYKWK